MFMSKEKNTIRQKKKIPLFIDADDTLLNSSETFIDIINKQDNINPPKTYDELKDWKYLSLFHNMTGKRVKKIYESDEFFDIVKIEPKFIEFFNKHKDDIEITIVTKGFFENIQKKEKYFQKHLPEAKVVGIPFCSKEEMGDEHCKANVCMKHGIQIDDRADCLNGTLAETKILFKKDKDFYWNRETDVVQDANNYIANTWDQIISILEYLIENPQYIKRCY